MRQQLNAARFTAPRLASSPLMDANPHEATRLAGDAPAHAPFPGVRMPPNRHRRQLLGGTLAALSGAALAKVDLDQETPLPPGPRPPLGADAAVDGEGRLWLLSAGAGQDLQLRVYQGAARFDEARSLGTPAEPIHWTSENAPRLAFGPMGRAALAYSTRGENHRAGRLRVHLSRDGGRSFGPALAPGEPAYPEGQGFASLAFDRSGQLHVSWLNRHAPGSPGAASGSLLYHCTANEAFEALQPPQPLASTSCQCCRTATAVSNEGQPAFLWRHIFPGGTRDNAFASSRRPGHVERIGHDRWRLDACPHHGPSLCADAAGGFHAVWFTHVAGEGRVRYGRLDADGRLRQSERSLPDPSAEHAVVAALGTQVVVLWRSFDGERHQLHAWLSRDSGRHFERRVLAQTPHAADHPRLASGSGRLYAVWQTATQVFVEDLA
ncbi:hypothetical protein H5407_07280 [Mitsuaria sp. WAJ17]|uniref:hypothetical protein n=1 Tax=Mitsuaria sp. WAJ17 TaxID=2761452 RepID=UPI001601D5BB|nr:hypothetical protein [Mitsuaria sp. WAJ17]MBB2485031.1 hypothetical protein [Mitsuaria sp. WAJ17]